MLTISWLSNASNSFLLMKDSLKCFRQFLTRRVQHDLFAARCDELSSSLTVGVPRRVVKKPIPAMKEALLRDALIARKVTPVKSTAPSKSCKVFQYISWCQCIGRFCARRCWVNSPPPWSYGLQGCNAPGVYLLIPTLYESSTYLHPCLFTFVRIYRFHFQSGGHEKWSNLAGLVICVYFLLWYILLRLHVCLCCVRFSFSVISQEIGWEESLQNRDVHEPQKSETLGPKTETFMYYEIVLRPRPHPCFEMTNFVSGRT